MIYWFKRKDGSVFSTEDAEAAMIYGQYEHLGTTDGKEYMRVLHEGNLQSAAVDKKIKAAKVMLAKLEEQELLILDEKKLKALASRQDTLKKKIDVLTLQKNEMYVETKKKAEEADIKVALTNRTPPNRETHIKWMAEAGEVRTLTKQEEANFYD